MVHEPIKSMNFMKFDVFALRYLQKISIIVKDGYLGWWRDWGDVGR